MPFEWQVLELEFSTIKGPAAGLRTLSRAQWDLVLEDAKCSILCNMSNDVFDSYVLSESSLFVYPHTAILKTCGTTTLLRCIARLLSYTEVRYVFRCSLSCCACSSTGHTRNGCLTLPRPCFAVQAIGMELEWVGYTRKNFTFPHKQLFPHTSPEDEVRSSRLVTPTVP